MALKPCSECSREISDAADSCPHCGARITWDPMAFLARLAVAVLLSFLVIKGCNMTGVHFS